MFFLHEGLSLFLEKVSAENNAMKTTKGKKDVRRSSHIGTHLICELFGCRGDLNSEKLAKKALVLGVRESGAHLLAIKIHKFSPQGLTAFALLQESHIAFHTWPEHTLVALDIFTCSTRKKTNPYKVLKVFRQLYRPSAVLLDRLKRGEISRDPQKAHWIKELSGDWHSDRALPGVEYLSRSVINLVKIKKRILKTKSPFQEIEVADTYEFGRIVILDGVLQTTIQDEAIYHEMLVHPAMLSRDQRRSHVLIIGGGDGGSLREVLRYRGVQKVFLCEIDKKVVEICRKFLPKIHGGSFDDPRAEIIFDDGARFVEKFSNFFDVVIVDSTDPFGPSKPLFTEKFYRAVFGSLKKDGVLSLQGGMSSLLEYKTLKNIVQALKNIYPLVEVRRAYVPSYFGVMNFVVARKKRMRGNVKERFKKLAITTRYYSPEIHESSKVLPPYLSRAIKL